MIIIALSINRIMPTRDISTCKGATLRQNKHLCPLQRIQISSNIEPCSFHEGGPACAVLRIQIPRKHIRGKEKTLSDIIFYAVFFM
jgi:hypothetical protein